MFDLSKFSTAETFCRDAQMYTWNVRDGDVWVRLRDMSRKTSIEMTNDIGKRQEQNLRTSQCTRKHVCASNVIIISNNFADCEHSVIYLEDAGGPRKSKVRQELREIRKINTN